MQKQELSGFFENNAGAPHSKKEGLIAPTSNSSSIYYFNNSCSWDFGGMVASILFQCLVLIELSHISQLPI